MDTLKTLNLDLWKTLISGVLMVLIGITGWSLNTLMAIDKDVAVIKSNRFSSTDWEANSRLLWQAIDRKADQAEVPSTLFRQYLDERFKHLEDQITDLKSHVARNEDLMRQVINGDGTKRN